MKLIVINVLLLNEINSQSMQIYYLTHPFINKEKWDQAILAADNGMIYACSWYLDCIAPHWDALVADDYEYVFPVTVKHKYKLPYIVQPFLAQQLGLFSKNAVSESVLQQFISRLPSYSYEINFNYANPVREGIPRINLVLDLTRKYSEIELNYSKNCRRNIAKARQQKFTLIDIDCDAFLKNYNSIEKKDQKVNQSLIGKVVKAGYQRGSFRCCALMAQDGKFDALLSYGIFNQRIVYLFPASTERGKLQSSMFMLIDELIKKTAGQYTYLDFEGSMIEGVARFYKGFGAIEQPYQILKQLRPSFLIGKI